MERVKTFVLLNFQNPPVWVTAAHGNWKFRLQTTGENSQWYGLLYACSWALVKLTTKTTRSFETSGTIQSHPRGSKCPAFKKSVFMYACKYTDAYHSFTLTWKWINIIWHICYKETQDWVDSVIIQSPGLGRGSIKYDQKMIFNDECLHWHKTKHGCITKRHFYVQLNMLQTPKNTRLVQSVTKGWHSKRKLKISHSP